MLKVTKYVDFLLFFFKKKVWTSCVSLLEGADGHHQSMKKGLHVLFISHLWSMKMQFDGAEFCSEYSYCYGNHKFKEKKVLTWP